jgi:hypothetical protein
MNHSSTVQIGVAQEAICNAEPTISKQIFDHAPDPIEKSRSRLPSLDQYKELIDCKANDFIISYIRSVVSLVERRQIQEEEIRRTLEHKLRQHSIVHWGKSQYTSIPRGNDPPLG